MIGNKVKIGKGTIIHHPELVNIYGNVEIGKNCMIGAFVEIQDDVKIGDGTRIQSHSFICSKTRIGKNVFIGHGVMTTNIKKNVWEKNKKKWLKTLIENNSVIGSGSVLLPVKVGRNSIVGAGSIVTKDVKRNSLVVGNPAKRIKKDEN